MKRWLSIILLFSIISTVSFSFVSAGFFSDFFGKITGQATAACSDSDGGKNYAVKGTLQYEGSTYVDRCYSQTHIFEYFCPEEGSSIIIAYHACENGCSDGVCLGSSVPGTPACSDSDGGKNYGVKGTLTYNGSVYNDTCVDSNKKPVSQGLKIFEYSCPASGSNIIGNYYDCINGCVNGVCVDENVNDQTAPNITINQPVGIKTSRTVGYNITIQESVGLDVCKYWVTGNTTISNTSVTCSNTAEITGNFLTTADLLHKFNFFANDTAGNFNIKTSDFVVDTSQAETGPEQEVPPEETVTEEEIPEQEEEISEAPSVLDNVINIVTAPFEAIVEFIGDLFGENDLTSAARISENPQSASIGELTDTVETYNDVLESNQSIQYATNRKEIMLELAKRDPEKFLSNAISPSVRAQYNEEVQAQIEQETSVEGFYQIVHTDDFEKMEKIDYPLFTTENNFFDLYTTEPLSYEPGSLVQFTGYTLENVAVAEKEQIAFISPPEQTPPPTQIRRIAVALIRYIDSPQTIRYLDPQTRFSRREAERIMNGPIRQYFLENSDGKFTFNSAVVDWINVPLISRRAGTCRWDSGVNHFDYSTMLDGLSRQIDISNYDTILVLYSVNCIGGPGGWARLGKVNGKHLAAVNIAQYNSDYIEISPENYEWGGRFYFVISHELGHTLNLGHSYGAVCSSTTFSSTSNRDCQLQEYGNSLDVMGTGTAGYFNILKKLRLKWIDESSGITITESGLYTLMPYEDGAGIKYAKVVKGDNPIPSDYFLEYRTPKEFDFFVVWTFWNDNVKVRQKGLSVILYPHIRFAPEVLIKPRRLIDLGVGDPFIIADLLLEQGESPLVDTATGITIGPVWSSDSSGAIFEVRFPGSGPYTTLNSSTNAVPYGQSVIISWESSPDASCTATSYPVSSWSGAKSSKGSQSIIITAFTTFRINCIANRISTVKTVEVGVSRYASPIQSFEASPTIVVQGGSTTLSWSAAPGSICYGSWVHNQQVPASGSVTVNVPRKESYSYSLGCSWNRQTEYRSVTVYTSTEREPLR